MPVVMSPAVELEHHLGSALRALKTWRYLLDYQCCEGVMPLGPVAEFASELGYALAETRWVCPACGHLGAFFTSDDEPDASFEADMVGFDIHLSDEALTELLRRFTPYAPQALFELAQIAAVRM